MPRAKASPEKAKDESGATCGQCKHWVGEADEGECHRYPPTVHFDEDLSYFLTRPPLAASERACGEFKGSN